VKAILHIDEPDGPRDVAVDDEISIGRTDLSQIVIDDPGLSRKNTTFFIDGNELLVADESSLNGTFVNGTKVGVRPQTVHDGDVVKIGSYVEIRIQIGDGAKRTDGFEQPIEETVQAAASAETSSAPPVKKAQPKPRAKVSPLVLVASGFMTFAFILLAAALYFVLRPKETGPISLPKPEIATLIPVRVIDPLGDEDIANDVDDLIASWETAETEIDASSVSDINVDSADAEIEELNVTAAFLAEQQKKALEPRTGPTGIRPAGLNVPPELRGDGVIKQKAKLREMKAEGYHQPLDFGDLAKMRLDRTLIEMPMAKQSFYLDVGGSATNLPFTTFVFNQPAQEIVPGMEKYQYLSTLADNFAGKKYDLNNAADRKQMRMRLLRMFQPRAKDILKELADAYHERFGRPLRVTSLTRSMDYQVLLNKGNANSFNVRSAEALPPHTSGCAFDLARKHMTADEQNFVMQKLAEMEKQGRLDALIEYGINACFHVFIYADGKAPKM
jgi:hypothetical protein